MPASDITKEELQHIASEVYKKNAELAVKNKVFSLLEKLYQASASGLDINPLCQELAQTISHSVDISFVAILTRTTRSQDFLCRGLWANERKIRNASIVPERIHVPRTHILYKTVSTKKKRHTAVFEKVVDQFSFFKKGIQIDIEEVVTLPLMSGRHVLGILILALPKNYSDFSRFEQQSIRNIANVVSVALDRSTVYEDLKRANEKLKEFDNLKTEFLSIATHQLRTPLSIIKGYISLLEEGTYGRVTKAQQEVYDHIDVSNERLIGLVDEFLNVSRIEQGRTQYQFEEMILADLIRDVIAQLSPKVQEKHIHMDVQIHTEVPMIGDYERIRHGVFNFIDNAIKYAPEDTSISVLLQKERSGFVFRVIDEGPGLDKNDLKALFTKFYRSPNIAQDFEGNGLGLYVVKEFIDGHGGDVWAKSTGLGEGSEFGFQIPIRPKRKRKK